MALIQLNSFTIQPRLVPPNLTSVTLRLWYNFGFIDSNGQSVQSGTSTTGTQIRKTCTVSNGIITVPNTNIWTTIDAQVPFPQTINLTAQFFNGGSPLPIYPFLQNGTTQSWIIYNNGDATINFDSLTFLNQTGTIAYPPQDYPTTQEMIAYVNSLVFANASASVKGVTYLDVDPDDPLIPKAVGVNSPLLAVASGFTPDNGFYNVTDPVYGLNLDGTTDDTAAFQALVDLAPNGSIIFFPPGTGIDMVLDGTILFDARHNIRLTSFNDYKFSNTPVPVLRRAGNAGGIMLSFQACFGCTVDGLRFTVDGEIDQFIAIDGNPTTSISSQNTVRNCSFQFSNGATQNEDWVAIYISQNANQNNELMVIENISVFGSDRASKYEGGSITASDTTLVLPTATLTNADIGERVRVGLAGANGRDLISTVASINSPTSCEIADPAVVTQTSTRCFIGQSYGTGIAVGASQNALHFRFINMNLLNCGIGIDIHEGSGYIDLVSGGTSDIDVRIRRSLAEGWTIRNIVTEGSLQTLYMDAGDQVSPCTVEHCRGANDSQASEGWMVLSGRVDLINNEFRVAPPFGGRYLYNLGNTADVTGDGNFFCQSGEVGGVDYEVIGYRGMRTWASKNDYGSEAYTLMGPNVTRPFLTGPYITHGPGTSSGLILPGLSSLMQDSSAATVRAIEAASGADTLLVGDGAIEISSAFRSQTPLAHKVGTHGGAATYIFCVVSVAPDGSRSLRTYPETAASVTNTLSGSNYVHLQWMSVNFASTYEIYLQNPANSAQGWQLTTGVANLWPLPSVYNLTANPTPSFVAWDTIVPTYGEASQVLVRSRLAQPIELTFSDADTTPTVRGGNRFVEENTNPTSITAFDNGIEGQQIRIRFTTTNTTIIQGGSMKLAGGVDFVGTASDMLTLERIGSVWIEVARSVNA